MAKNFTITVTFLEDENVLKFQATCENVLSSDVSYFLDTINDEIKKGVCMEGLNRNNGGYIEEYINLT
ncbi:MAG: hypothetical protein ABIP51_11760 [Bacteroidia bacterium]